jgi:thiosulfate/3-mercaptopyruvate sulfurtransferase
MSISLLTIEQLQPMLGNKSLTIVDCRAPEDYEERHIPGAVRLAWEDWCEKPRRGIKEILTSPGYWGALDDPEQGRFAERFEELGIVRDSHIVVYSSARASKGRDGRIAWMFAYLGAPHVSILNGGFPAWLAADLPTEQGLKPCARGAFEIAVQPQRRCVTKDLVAKLNTDEFPLLIDTRSPKEFEGGLFWYQPRTGRIPGSRLLPFDAVFQSDGKHFVTAQEYATLLPDSFASAKSVATYCEVGVRAATVALLHEVYTGQVLRVYDGSMIEWSMDARLPVERG